tara:strand:- start:141 stop:629 length:489 start_codon:yes stop_codon:yes gene_type:complete
MKKLLFLFLLPILTYSQTSHNISSGNFYYYPSVLNINIGDTVSWINDGGYHNVNFDINTITGSSFNNPEAFISSPTSGPVLYTHVFNTPGNYDYDCSVGSHAVMGMIGTIIVNNVSFTNEITSEKKLIKIINTLGRESSHTENQLLLYIYSNGTIEKKMTID